MDIILRKINESDCDLLFKWVNDTDVRENSFNPEEITYNEHQGWFRRKLYSDNNIIYICYINEVPIGQIRIEVEGKLGVIDYSIDKEFRGKGYGAIILMKAEEEIKKDICNISKLTGRVKYHNIASQKSFVKAGYITAKADEYIEFIKDI